MYLDDLVQKLNRVRLNILKQDWSTYTATVTATASVEQDMQSYKLGVIKVSFIVPANAPNWDDMQKRYSWLYIKDVNENTDFVALTFATLEKLGITDWVQNSEFSLYIVIPSLVIA